MKIIKKIAVLSIIMSIYAYPMEPSTTLQAADMTLRFAEENNSTHGSLRNLVKGGKPPYSFSVKEKSLDRDIRVVVNPDGSFVFTPVNNFFGQTSFQYKVTDSNGTSKNGTVNAYVEEQ